jgi:hypothetical protein
VTNVSQTVAGKAFEYAILDEFREKLAQKTNVQVKENEPYERAKESFFALNEQQQGRYKLTASFAVNFLADVEPRLSDDIAPNDILELEILGDKQGVIGDARDVLIIRSVQKWEIGISAKHNHDAVKHPRLSSDIDFGQQWLGVPCSAQYFEQVRKLFEPLRKIKEESNSKQTWDTLEDKESQIYRPLLLAFRKELFSLYQASPQTVPENLVTYLVGNRDFYKVIKRDNEVEIFAYNLHGTLNKSSDKRVPKYKLSTIKLPTRIVGIEFKENSNTTLIVTFDRGWELSFRIHNASSRIEPSLKFDINLLSAPHNLFSIKLSITE